jgi:hypothetical protein
MTRRPWVSQAQAADGSGDRDLTYVPDDPGTGAPSSPPPLPGGGSPSAPPPRRPTQITPAEPVILEPSKPRPSQPSPSEPITPDGPSGRSPGTGGTPKGPIKKGTPPGTTDPLDPADPGEVPPKPRKPRPVIQQRAFTFQRQKTPLRVVYGPRHIRGAHVTYFRRWSSGTNSGRTLVVYDLEWGPSASISNITFEGKTLAGLGLSSGTDYNLYLGDGAASIKDDAIGIAKHGAAWNTAWTAAIAAEPAADTVARLVVFFKRPGASIPAVDPQAIEYDSGGMKVCDPDQDATLTTRYARSDNPRLAIADMETDNRYGGGFPTSIVYGEPGFQDAVDDCDEDLGGGRKRYTIGIELDETEDFSACIETLRGHAALCFAYDNGYRRWWVDKDRPATGIEFGDGPGSPANIISVGPLEYKGSGEFPTRVIVNYTDSSNRDAYATSEHPSLASGGVELVEWSYDYRGIRTHDQAQRIANYLRKKHSIDKHGTIRVKAEGLRVLPGSRITLTNVTQWNVSTSDWEALKVSPTPNASSWDLDVQPYDSSVHDDTEQTTTSYTPAANPSPYDAPDAPTSPAGAGSLTVGDGFTEQSDGKYAVSFLLPEWPFRVEARATAQYGSGAEVEIGKGLGPFYVDRSVLPTVKIYTVVVESGATSSALSGTVGATTPPEITEAIADYTATPATLSFEAPRTRTSSLYGSGFWSHSGLTSFTASRVNDGLTALKAFDYPGAGITSASVQYGTSTAGPWSSATKRINATSKDMGGGVTRRWLQWNDVGAYRCWSLLWGANRLIFDAGAGNTKAFRECYIYHDASDNVLDVQFMEYGGTPAVRGARVYALDVSLNRSLAMPEIPVAAFPTPAKPLNLEFLAGRVAATWETAGSNYLRVAVTTVSPDGTESEGWVYSSFAAGSAAGGTSEVTSVGTLGVGTSTIPSGRAVYVNQGGADTFARIEGSTSGNLELLGGTQYWRLSSTAGGSSSLIIRNANTGVNALEFDTQSIPKFTAAAKRVGTQFDRVSSTVLTNVTDLSVSLVAGRTYEFEAHLLTTSSSAGGVKVAIGGTATATSVRYEALVFQSGACVAQGRASALGTAVAGITSVTDALVIITGTIVVNAAGTLTVQFAQNASFASISSVLTLSKFWVWGA